jgi:hypothetical protein
MASIPQPQHTVVSFAEVFLEGEALRYSQKDECKQCSTTKQSGVWPALPNDWLPGEEKCANKCSNKDTNNDIPVEVHGEPEMWSLEIVTSHAGVHVPKVEELTT